MPDLFTGEEEIELLEAKKVIEAAIARAQGTTSEISSLGDLEDLLGATIEAEAPTPLMCPTCTDPGILAKAHPCPTCNVALNHEGKTLDGEISYLPLEGAQ